VAEVRSCSAEVRRESAEVRTHLAEVAEKSYGMEMDIGRGAELSG